MDYNIDEYSINPQETHDYVNHRKNGYDDPFETIWLDNDNSYPHMPGDMLAAKFEETVLAHEEENYDDYMRQAVTDKGPDPNLLGDVQPHRTENSDYRLNLQYHGTTGKQELPYNPEAFVGIIGNHGDRPYWQEIDWQEMNRQNDFRMNRYQNFRGENDNTIIGSGVNPLQALNMNHLSSCRWGKQLAIFSREQDNILYGLKYFTKPQPVKCYIQKRDISATQEIDQSAIGRGAKRPKSSYKAVTKDFTKVINFASGSRGNGTKKTSTTTPQTKSGMEAFESSKTLSRKLGVQMSKEVAQYTRYDADIENRDRNVFGGKNLDILRTVSEMRKMKYNIDAQISVESETRTDSKKHAKDISRHTNRMQDDQIEFAQIIAKMVYPEKDQLKSQRRQKGDIELQKMEEIIQYQRLKTGANKDNRITRIEELTEPDIHVKNYKTVPKSNTLCAFNAQHADGEYGTHSCILKGAVNRYIDAANYANAEVGDMQKQQDRVDDLKIAPLGKKSHVRRYTENELHQNDF